MSEFSVPADFTIPDDANLTDAVLGNAAEHPDEVIFDRKVDGSWQPVTAKQFADEVKALAAGLIAAGIQPGDRVCIMSSTRYEWTLLDYAIWTAGAVTVPIYETSSTEQVEWIVSDSGAVGIFLETASHRRVLRRGAAPRFPARSERVGHRGRRDRRAAPSRQGRHRGRHRAAPPDAARRQPGHHHLHLGHDRPPEGLRADPRQLPVRRDLDRRGSRGDVRLRTSRPCCSCRWRTCSPGSSRSAACRAGSGWGTPPTSRT